MCGVADVVALGTGDFGEARFEGGDDFRRVVDRKRGLRDVGKLCGVFDDEFFDVFDVLDQEHVFRALPHGTFDFRVAFVADHDDFAPVLAHSGDLEMDFGNQWAGGVEYFQTAGGGFFAHGLGNTVGAENDGATGRHGGEVVNEDGAFFAQVVADKFVMYDFMADVDRGAEFFDGAFDYGDGSFNAGAEAAGGGEDDLHGAFTSLLKDSDDFDFKAKRFAGQRMIEIDGGGGGGQFAQKAGNFSVLLRVAELDWRTFFKFDFRREQTTGDGFDELRVVVSKGRAGIQMESSAFAGF